MSRVNELKRLAQELSLLYVEDDCMLRESTSELFEDLFKELFIAQDGLNALEVYEEYFDKNGAYIDLIISDIAMPRMDGIALAKELFKINENQKVLIVSAYNDTEYLIELINIGVSGFMQKPLSLDQVLSTLFDACLELESDKESLRYRELPDNFVWDHKNKTLTQKETLIKLSESEKNLFDFFIEHSEQNFTALELFDCLFFNEPEKKFSSDTIKSLIKRLRKKLPPNLINNTPNSGYSFKNTL
ncbi:MAG: response regulator [Campylobacterota bacterium]|nr:response regulator [Campylobacterota bacterium]